ncbi:MAG: histidinol-phosphatase HisJ family protein [Oscillospiraceae bacterium]|nr:histidinol-phosphatase HisJ family protein [Oscillospiraceae bacterium]
MYLIDYHSHSILSPDGNVPLCEMADAAVNAGLSELCLTDHYDIQDLDGKRTPPYEWGPALEQFHTTAPRYGDKLQLRLGIELGGAPVDPDYCAALLQQPELDFVIGSLHNLSPASGGGDFYCHPYPDEAACYTALDDYFTSMEALVLQPDLYDVLGHIIYPLRYMLPGITLDRFWDRIAEILRAAIQRDRGMEVNTCRGVNVADWRPLLALYRDLGGTLLTVGADAHIPAHVGGGIPEAYALIQEMGFRHVAVYHRRQPTLIPI